jgi:uncharacterized membrane protein YraQ (UPF0718 family)
VKVNKELRSVIFLVAIFLAFFLLPLESETFRRSIMEALGLAKLYAREHVILCLVPAFFIAGAISVFISQAAVIKYLGARANKVLAYGVASVSGAVLAVCSCTILPLFAGIYKRGAGLGPACAFLYAGPAINVLAIILTARILGLDIGIARAVAAVGFSVVIGLLMALIFRRGERQDATAAMELPQEEPARPLWKNGVYFGTMVAVLVFANWGESTNAAGFWHFIHAAKWMLTGLSAVVLAGVLALWFDVRWSRMALAALPVLLLAFAFPNVPEIPFAAGVIGLIVVALVSKGETEQWVSSTWVFVKQILPLLFWGIVISGFLLGGPGGRGIIPPEWVETAVGGNSLRANLFASVVGALMYFVTLTEVPILQGLIASGMGKGPALALLLAGPALSLPSMLVLGSVMGLKKTLVFIALVVVMATTSGMLFGAIAG